MLPWIFGRQTLTIVVSSPCMTQAQITVAVVSPRCGTAMAADADCPPSPLTPTLVPASHAVRRRL